MLYTVDWVAKNYEKYNQLIWGGALPSFNSVNLSFTKSKSHWGEAGCARWLRDKNNIPYASQPVLRLSNYYDSPEDIKLNTLVHEMCHLYEYFCETEYIVKAVMSRRYTREYPRDGHGKVFNEQAKRIKDICGLEITRFVKSSEIENSDLSDNVRERYLKKIKKLNGIDIFLLKLIGNKAPYGYVKVEAENVKEKWYNFFHSERCKYYISDIILCKSFDVNCINLPTSKLSSRLTWYLLDDVSKFINDYNLKFEETLLGSENAFISSDNKVASIPSEKRYKSFTLKFTNGTILKYDNITKREVAERLQKVFPKWSSEIINKFVNDEKLYTENMKKDNLDILIERVLRDNIDSIVDNEELSVSDEDMDILNNNFLMTIN